MIAYEYGYQDAFYVTTIDNPITGQWKMYGYFWWNPDGVVVASSDPEFRDGPYKRLISQYNNDVLGNTSMFGLVSPVVGLDFTIIRITFGYTYMV